MTASQQLGVAVLVLFAIPIAVLGSGIYTWWRRR
jgi:hypothetical protein